MLEILKHRVTGAVISIPTTFNCNDIHLEMKKYCNKIERVDDMSIDRFCMQIGLLLAVKFGTMSVLYASTHEFVSIKPEIWKAFMPDYEFLQ